jgi:hypothetical protein
MRESIRTIMVGMRLPRIRNLFRRKRNVVILIIVLIAAGAAGYFLTRGKDPVVDVPVPGEKFYSQLTGNEVSKDESKRPILGIMIENSEEARPQTGLDSAGIVFETVTEAGITRYLAMYQENMPEEVGPVRSVRPYFVDWFMGFDASVAHVGGSSTALEIIEQRKSKSINEFYNAGAFYRSSDREAPHNVYARTKDLVQLQEKLGHKISEMKDIPRSDDAPAVQPSATTISVNYSVDIFKAQFKYDQATNSYTRYLAGVPHVDKGTGKPITVKNLIVIKMRGDVDARGEGKALLYKDGTMQEINWKQANFYSRIELLDSAGKEVPLNRGDSWFAVIPSSGSVDNL